MSIDTDYAVLRTALKEMTFYDGWATRAPGWAAEFGVYSGYSLRLIAEHMPVIGFDSFEGLPEDWREGFPKGAFNVLPNYAQEFHGDGTSTVTEQVPMPFTANAMIVPGLFSDTLSNFLFPHLTLVHIDCDLYSSTVTALDAVVNYITDGTVIVFDEFHGYEGWEDHEAKAWREFCDKHRVIYRTVATGEQERAFVISSMEGGIDA